VTSRLTGLIDPTPGPPPSFPALLPASLPSSLPPLLPPLLRSVSFVARALGAELRRGRRRTRHAAGLGKRRTRERERVCARTSVGMVRPFCAPPSVALRFDNSRYELAMGCHRHPTTRADLRRITPSSAPRLSASKPPGGKWNTSPATPGRWRQVCFCLCPPKKCCINI